MTRPFGRTLLEAIASGIVCSLPLGLWVGYRALPFNETLGIGERWLLLAYLCAIYALVGAGIGAFFAIFVHRSERWRDRAFASVAMLLLPAWSAWFFGARWALGGGFLIGALLGASLASAVLLVLGAISHGRHGLVLTAVLVLELALAVRLPLHRRFDEASPELIEQLRSAAAESRTPLVILGIDGMERAILEEGIARGELPNFAQLWSNGLRAPLKTLEPTWSPPLWTSFWTGKLPKDHGINYFLAQGSYQLPGAGAVVIPRLLGARWVAERSLERLSIPVNQKQRRATAVWEVLGLAGRESVLANRLVSWPVLPLRGVELSSRLLLDDEATSGLAYPDSLSLVVRRRLEQVSALADSSLRSVPWLARDLARERELWRLATREAQLRDAALLLLYTHLIDSAQHRYLKYHWPERFAFEPESSAVEQFGDVVAASYRHVDAMVGELLASRPDCRVLLISDHGVEPNLELHEDLPEPAGALRMPDADEASISGVHGKAPDGVFCLAGPGVSAGELDEVNLLAVAPLILRLLGLPEASDMELRAPVAVLNRVQGLSAPVSPVRSYEGLIPRDVGLWSGEADESVLEQLRALGYIE